MEEEDKEIKWSSKMGRRREGAGKKIRKKKGVKEKTGERGKKREEREIL